MIQLIFEIEPTVKERPRFSSSAGGNVHVRTPKQTLLFENFIKVMARKQFAGPMIESPVFVSAVFTFKRPKKKNPKPPRKDLDNLCKSVFDALNGIVYRDDTQITGLMAQKQWADRDAIIISIKETTI